MPVESRDDLVTRDEMLEALANQRRALCAAHDEDRAELKRVREYAAKRIAELEAERERLWCTACGTVTRDNVCDCNRWPHLADAGYKPNFVNYADALNEQTRDLAEKLESAERALAECERLLSRYFKETPLGHQPHMIAHEADAAIKVATAIRSGKPEE